MKKLLSAAFVFLLLFSFAACKQTSQKPPSASAPTPSDTGQAAPSGSLVVYSPHDADPLNDGINQFMEKYPGIQVEIVAAGTGELCNRIKAESAAPIADVLWGGGADSLASFKEYFQPYVSVNDNFIDDAYKDRNHFWLGESPLPMVIFYNLDLLKKDGLPIPTSWEDLTDPQWKGKIAYCLPSKSGSAYTQLCTLLFAHGGVEEGWSFVEKLYNNLDGRIVDSSGKCHKMVADGEFYVGLTLEKAAVKYADDPSVGFVYPSDGTSAVPDGIAMIKDCPNPENAKLFIDFVTSRECQIVQAEKWGRRPIRNDLDPPAGMAKLSDLHLVEYDFDWAANNKETVINRFNSIMVG